MILKLPSKYIPKQNQTTIFIENGKEFCIANLNGKIIAIDNLCPHQGASLGLGEIKGDEILCPLHQYRFSLKDGSCNIERFCIERYEVEFID